jgi:multicomponent Na+:H+ antiporter subunit A
VKRIVTVDVAGQVVFHVVVVVSVFVLFVGHNQPGGGFVGGLLFGAAVALRYVTGGIDEVRSLFRFKPWTALGSGLLIASAVAAAPLLVGHDLEETSYRSVHLPVFGKVGLSSALVFDLGVYLVVVGVVLMVIEAFGEDLPAEPPEEVER